jgi:hypothetical protein
MSNDDHYLYVFAKTDTARIGFGFFEFSGKPQNALSS